MSILRPGSFRYCGHVLRPSNLLNCSYLLEDDSEVGPASGKYLTVLSTDRNYFSIGASRGSATFSSELLTRIPALGSNQKPHVMISVLASQQQHCFTASPPRFSSSWPLLPADTSTTLPHMHRGIFALRSRHSRSPIEGVPGSHYNLRTK